MARPPRARRSCHVVPGTSPRMLAKAAGLAADEVILDLEDSVAEGRKGDDARAAVAAAAAGGLRARTVAVRVNAAGGPHHRGDLEAVLAAAGAAIDVVVLPKVDDPADVVATSALLDALEAAQGLPPGRIGIEAQVESARSLLAAPAIAAAAPDRMEALVVGPGDLASDLGMPHLAIGDPLPGYPGDGWHHVLMTVLVAARAHGLQAVDGPYARLGDEDGLRASSARSAALGYDGKWSIHPSQIPVLDDAYGVSPDDLARARRILDAHAAAAAAGEGAARLDGEMIDEATRAMAAMLVARAALHSGG
ncbi:MAG: CoA ester lyase [Thermoleophilia bacterium]